MLVVHMVDMMDGTQENRLDFLFDFSPLYMGQDNIKSCCEGRLQPNPCENHMSAETVKV